MRHPSIVRLSPIRPDVDFLDEFERQLHRFVNEENMGLNEIAERLKAKMPLSMTYKDGGKREVYHYGDRDVELPAMASDDQIVQALMTLQNANLLRRPMLKTQGLAQKLALLKHDLETQAEQLGKRVDDAATKSTQTFAKSHAFLDSAHSDLAEVEKFISDLDAATNGGPA